MLAPFFYKKLSWAQPMEVAEEKPNLYRLKDWYHNAGTDFSDSGYNLTFLWDGSSEVSFTVPADEDGGVSFPTGWSHPMYDMLYMYINPGKTNYDSESKTFTFNCFIIFADLAVAWTNDTFTLE